MIKEYKIELSKREKINEDAAPIALLNKVSEIRDRLRRSINRHNYLIDLREEIAKVPYEYMRSQLKEIDNDENRNLLARGCTAEIDELSAIIKGINAELRKALPVENVDVEGRY